MHLIENWTFACGKKIVYFVDYDIDNDISSILLSATIS